MWCDVVHQGLAKELPHRHPPQQPSQLAHPPAQLPAAPDSHLLRPPPSLAAGPWLMILDCKLFTTSGRSPCARTQKSHNAADDPQKSLASPLLLLRLLCPWALPLGSSKLVRPSVDARPDLVSCSPIRPDLVHERSRNLIHTYACRLITI